MNCRIAMSLNDAIKGPLAAYVESSRSVMYGEVSQVQAYAAEYINIKMTPGNIVWPK